MNWLSSVIGSQSSQVDELVEDKSAMRNDGNIADEHNETKQAADETSNEYDDSIHTQSSSSDEAHTMAVTHMDAKLTAVTRATLHLSDNSFTFGPRNETDDIDISGNAPIGWKQQYNELFTLLRTGLLGFRYGGVENSSKRYEQGFKPDGQTNVSAVLMGPRGQGKSFILERCLSDLSVLAGELQRKKGVDGGAREPVAFRVVRLNGLLYAGQNAVACVREIARQIGEMAGETQTKQQISRVSSEKKRKLNQGCTTADRAATASNELAEQDGSPSMNDHDTPKKALNFSTRRSGFTSNISLLDEALQTARIDNIPILIILEELESFISKGKSTSSSTEEVEESSARQLLLYHLLDRVADCKFLVSLVGLTSDLSTSSKLEKRVLSRAEGTSKFIHFGRVLSYNDLIESALMPFHTPFNGSDRNEEVAMLALRKEVEYILRGGDNYRKGDEEMNDYALIRHVLEHNFHLRDMDMRWFCRVLDVALGIMASGIEENKASYLQSYSDREDGKAESEPSIPLTPYHMATALTVMGAFVCNIVRAKGHGPSPDSLVLSRWERILDGPYEGNDPRIRALLDLTGPQVAVLLAARRIMARDDTRSTIEDDVDYARKNGVNKKAVLSMVSPITYQRIYDEYTTSFVASGRYTISSDRYPSHLLYRAFTDLMELNLLRLKKDHSKRGPLQYEHCDALSSGANVANLPLLINLAMEDEFLGLLKGGVLHCSTALREWGLKIS